MGLVVLAGGTGSAKLLRGLRDVVGEFTVISNVGDNLWSHGLYVAPDVDIAVYALAGIGDVARGWGLKDETFNVLGQLARIGEETWFNLGDRDLATHIFRTERLAHGKRLGEVTEELCARLGVAGQRVIPCTDDRLETHIVTATGTVHLQEFWVKERGAPEVLGVEYRGADGARPARAALDALAAADRIVFCPANPVTSILPILAVDGIRQAVAASGATARRVAVSPMVGDGPVTGPAGKLMRAVGAEPTSRGVARLYRGLVDRFLIDASDSPQAAAIQEEGGMEAVPARILMATHDDEVRLAREVIDA
ncbi:MAG: 2-phospho-L-lactate transferase [Nitrososphaerales archaeon]|jgi:LPPG:FO 2-phospho-L-lactate transferase